MKTIVAVLLSLLIPSLSFAESFSVNKVCNTSPALKLTSVEVTEDETIISFTYDWTHKEAAERLRIWPPGHDKSFFITDIRKTNKYLLLDVEGASIAPNWSKPNSFTLIFEKIPDNLKRFHLVEGNLMASGAWNFVNVKLKK